MQEPVKEHAYLVGVLKCVTRSRLCRRLVTDTNGDATVSQHSKCIFIRFVVSEVHWQNAFRPIGAMSPLKQKSDRFALVPVHIGAYLNDTFPRGHAQEMIGVLVGNKRRDIIEDQWNLLVRRLAKMYGNREHFVFHDHAGIRLHGALKRSGQSAHRIVHMIRYLLDFLYARPVNFEPMVSGVRDTRDANTRSNVCKRAATYDMHMH